jgi:hypothetical protein
MTGPATPPPQAVLMQLVNGMVVSRCLAVAAELAIADHLAGGAADAAALAERCGVDAGALYRVLRTLSGLGVFVETQDRQFQNSPLSEALRSDAQGSVRNIVRWLGHPMHWRVLGDLDYSVRTGSPSVTKDHPGQTPFGVLSQDAGAQAVFNAAMTGLSLADGAAIISAYDFSPYRRIVDVGGGHGSLAVMMARAAPSASVTIYDLPHVVQGAAQNIATPGLEGRLHAAGGSFLDAVPGPADLCVLKYILHLCDDESATRILRNCRGALSDGGRLLVCEMVISPGPDGIPARIMDIEMMTGTGGRERTQAEFSKLFQGAGLVLKRVIETRTPIRLLEVETERG